MRDRIKVKWRPPLLLVLGGALSAVLVAPLAGLLVMRELSETLGFGQSALLIGGLSLVATLVLGLLLWRLLLRPITSLADRAGAVRTGQSLPHLPLPHYGTRELRDLGQSVLDMAATLQNREAAIRSFTDHVSHELKTPITAIRGAAEILEASPALDPQDRQLTETILLACARMEQHLAALRRVAVAREPTHYGTSCIDDLAADLRADVPGMRVDIEGGAIAIPLGPEGLRIVLRHLVENSGAHGAGLVTVKVIDDGLVRILVTDDGAGISEGNRGRIFAPFYTTRREDGGTGMGLSIVRSLLQSHGGDIELLATTTGAAFRIEF